MNRSTQKRLALLSLIVLCLWFLSLSACSKQGAEQDAMTLSAKQWVWQKTLYNNDTSIEPKEADAFTITFAEGQRAQIGTDCNRMQARYAVKGNKIEFSELLATRMFCEDSQEQVFADMLGNANAYFFDNRNQLILELKFDSGSMIFQ
jgi:heat shock protein HslJ